MNASLRRWTKRPLRPSSLIYRPSSLVSRPSFFFHLFRFCGTINSVGASGVRRAPGSSVQHAELLRLVKQGTKLFTR